MSRKSNTLLTTSFKPNTDHRRLAKIFEGVIPNAIYFNRARFKLSTIFENSKKQKIKKIIIIEKHKKFNDKAWKIKLFFLKDNEFVLKTNYIIIWKVIDHLIYGFKEIPGEPPISSGLVLRKDFPMISNIFEEIFELQIGKKTGIWLGIDKSRSKTQIQLIDPVTFSPFFSAYISINSNGTSI